MPVSNKKCKYCENNAKLNIINGRNKGYCKTCGSNDCLKKQYKDKNVSIKKGRRGELNKRWIEDRSKLKQKRKTSEEKWFFKELIEKRNYKCELTGENGTLSVHHLKGVWSNPELRFCESNCIVILSSIHTKFHKIYGFRSTHEDFIEFVNKKEYEGCFNKNKRLYAPFIDRTGLKYGRLTVLHKEGKKWKCICDCGVKKLVSTGNLKNTNSCGCLSLEIKRKRCLENPIWVNSPRSNKKIRNV